MNGIQILVLVTIVIFLQWILRRNRSYLDVPVSMLAQIAYFGLDILSCFLVGAIVFVILNLFLNFPRLYAFADVIYYSSHVSSQWPVLPTAIGLLFAFLAFQGFFNPIQKTRAFIRGREFISKLDAQQRLRGKALAESQSLLKRLISFCTTLKPAKGQAAETSKDREKEGSVTKPEQVRAIVPTKKPSPENMTVFWGMIDLPLDEASGHFLVTGAPGSGKSLSLWLLMQSILPHIGMGYGMRAFIFDPKRDMLPNLTGFLPKGDPRLYVLNPFDKRSAMWDMAKDITNPTEAAAIAAILIPQEPHSTNKFFPDAAQQILAGMLRTFITKCPLNWTLRDVVLAMRTVKRIRAVLGLVSSNGDLLDMYMKEERTGQNVLSTIVSKIQPLEIIAALWERTNDKISLSDWLNEESILVAGHDPSRRATLDPLYQAIFHRLSSLVLSLPELNPGKTWIFFDELREAGRMEGLTSLLNQGRSKGASVVLGTQSKEGLDEVYGQNVSDEITGQCSNKTFLRTDSYRTAQWAEQHFGHKEVIEASYNEGTSSDSQGGSSNSQGVNYSQTTKTVLMASELMSLPKAGPRYGLPGFHDIPLVGSYFTNEPWNKVLNLIKTSTHHKEPGEIQRDASEQYVTDWTEKDIERLGLRFENTAEKNPLL